MRTQLGAGVLCVIVLAGCGPGFEPPTGPSRVGPMQSDVEPGTTKIGRAPRQPGGKRLPPPGSTPKAVVTGTVEVSQSNPSPDQFFYGFTVRLTESAGIAANIISAFVSFDNGWGGECTISSHNMVHTRLPANGTLQMDYLTCSGFDWEVWFADIGIKLKDDNGNTLTVWFSRDVRVGAAPA